MKVILLQELKGRGGEGDVVEVARGFAVNYLFPRKVAIEATSGNLKQLEQRRHNIETREEGRITDAASMAAALDGKTVRIGAKVGEEGRLFGSVTSHMVADAIAEQLGIEVDRRKIETHGHIKDVGPHPVDVAIYRDVKATLTVEVHAEGVELPDMLPELLAEVEGVEPAAEAEAVETEAAETVDQTAEEPEAGEAEAEAGPEEAAEEAAPEEPAEEIAE